MKKIKERIRITSPSITQKEIDMVTEAAKNAWGKNAYSYIRRFEQEFAKYIGVKYAMATSSCLGALHLSLLALDIKKGDEVIVPDITWVSTALCIKYVGATPVFADIDEKTWCIDPKSIKKNITKKTRAIIPVDLYGHVADMNPILTVAKKHNLFVIEDAAEAIGAKYYGKKAGSFGDFSAFSFHGTKALTTGEGGMLLTNSESLYKRAYFLGNLAKSSTKAFWVQEVGYKYLMSDLQASLGLAQLSRINDLVSKKTRVFKLYEERLGNINGLTLNSQEKNTVNSYWMVTVILDKKFGLEKEEIMRKLNEKNIDPRPFFYPLSSMPPFKTKVNNPVAYDISERGINLPCGHNITDEEVNDVCHSLLEILNVSKRYDR